MVGRELHTICPLGEDHQGDDRGGRTADFGMFSNGRRSLMIVWRSLTLMKTIYKALGWIKVMVKQDLFLMSFNLLV